MDTRGPADASEQSAEFRDEAISSRAPALPIEAPLVRAVRALEGLNGQTAALLFLLETAPRNDAALNTGISAVIARTNEAADALWHLQQIRSCGGQA